MKTKEFNNYFRHIEFEFYGSNEVHVSSCYDNYNNDFNFIVDITDDIYGFCEENTLTDDQKQQILNAVYQYVLENTDAPDYWGLQLDELQFNNSDFR